MTGFRCIAALLVSTGAHPVIRCIVVRCSLIGFAVIPALGCFAGMSDTHAEDSREEFSVIDWRCPRNGDDLLSITKGNADGRYVRFTRQYERIFLAARNGETGSRFKTTHESKIKDVARITDPEVRGWFTKALSQIAQVEERVCNDTNMQRRYRDMVEQNRRNLGVALPPD